MATRGITQSALADAIGNNASEVNRLLSGERPLLGMIERISTHLKIQSPIFIAESEADLPQPDRSAPVEGEPIEAIIRKNAIRFREEAGFDQFNAAAVSGIAREQLRRYEDGTDVIPTTDMAMLAKIYSREPGHFFVVNPPPLDPERLPKVRTWVHPSVAEAERERIQAEVAKIAATITPEFRGQKKAMLEHMEKARRKDK